MFGIFAHHPGSIIGQTVSIEIEINSKRTIIAVSYVLRRLGGFIWGYSNCREANIGIGRTINYGGCYFMGTCPHLERLAKDFTLPY